MLPMSIFLVLLVFFVYFLVRCIRIVPQGYVCVVERLGRYLCTWNAGIHLKLPVIDHVNKKISMKEQVCDFPPQPVITKDNVTMLIDCVVYMRVFNAESFTYGIENAINGLSNLSATNLRSIVGEMELDQTLSSREEINRKMLLSLDEATDPWGIKVTRVEIKNIQPPKEIEEVMTKQMKAERERRETVLQAEAHQESIVKRAEGDKRAKVLAAEAERDSRIAVAEGKAASVRMVYEAEAEGLRKLREAQADGTVLNLKALEALEKVADGNATKIFFPNELSGLFTVVGAASEIFRTGEPVSKEHVAVLHEDSCCDGGVNAVSTGSIAALHDIEDDVSDDADER